ncbi:hypothetical protein [Corynebacterium urealyticum]|uniref:hypothetical protein n=1 Tax=Corynebacterium urealyticum TaxID=43771 RepID=UPI00034BDA47|nr:hypothetical protein [Corynebacterium urealyticum]QQB07633.1 hypothetical protein I6H53_00265 [Corynebacterium urealyticum]
MKKTIIALAAASSVALSHGVAVAEPAQDPAQITANDEQGNASQENQGNPEVPNTDDESKGKGSTGSSSNDQEGEDDGRSALAKFFGWDEPGKEPTHGFKKFTDIAAGVAAIVAFLGSISALIANIEKIAKQFMK